MFFDERFSEREKTSNLYELTFFSLENESILNHILWVTIALLMPGLVGI
jgi:hypothetical protein